MPKPKTTTTKAKDESPKTVKTHVLKLTKYELIHLRDLFSVTLPDASASVSQCLASLDERSLVESQLWTKIYGICRDAGVPLDDDAPDFVITAAGPPTLGVFHLADSPDADEDEEESEEEDDAEDSEEENESLFRKKE
jgi:hypothetical protein